MKKSSKLILILLLLAVGSVFAFNITSGQNSKSSLLKVNQNSSKLADKAMFWD